jgi:hypothetical protein
MPGETVPRVFTSNLILDIPLHLLPKTIADLIKGKHTSVYRITAMKTYQNRYMVIIETRKRTRRKLPHGDVPGCQGRESG